MKVADLQRNLGSFPLKPGNLGPTRIRQHLGKNPSVQKGGKPFAEVLNKEIKEQEQLRFSAHAMRRIEERQVPMGSNALHRLDQGIRQLEAKGSRNSVVFVDDTAFVVSVRNKTVVTAVDRNNANSNIFTNIDSVAIV